LDEQGRAERLHQRAAEVILGSSSLTDGLSDDEAGPLVAWGLVQAEAAADEAADDDGGGAMGTLALLLPDDDLRAALAGRLSPVRRVMKAISDLAAARRELSAQQMVAELGDIRTLAGELPKVPALAITDTTLAELAAWQQYFDKATFVRAILVLLDPEPTSGEE
jgi:hypothetical protein